jgi:hypothetical protein
VIQLTMVGAVVAVAGAVVAVSARDARLVAAGLLLAMIAAPLASSPEPTFTALAFRLLGAILAAYLLWAATRTDSISSEGSGIGLPAEVVAAAGAFCVGWYVTPVMHLSGPLAAQAAGLALVVLAVGPLTGKNMLRSGVAIAVVALGISLLTQAWAAPASSLGQIVTTAVMVGVIGATGLMLSPTDTEVEWPDETDVLDAVLVEDGDIEPGAASESDEDDLEAIPLAGRARRLGVREPRR